jgi:hypothetical protein
MMARAINMSEGNYSSFLKGNRGIGAESTCLLLKYVNQPKQQAIAQLTQSPISSRMMLLQEQGRSMRLDNTGWYPGADGSGAGQDPNDGRTIDDAPDAVTAGPAFWDQDLIDVLRETRGFHRKAVRAINDYITKAKANAGIVIPSSVNQKFARR